MTPVEAVRTVFLKYADFSSRATRPEYWWWVLFQLVSTVVLGFVPVLGGLWSLVILLPGLAVTVRRLHDIGRSGWFVLLPWAGLPLVLLGAAIQGGILQPLGNLVILVGAIVLVVWTCLDGEPGANRFGPDPKGRPAPRG